MLHELRSGEACALPYQTVASRLQTNLNYGLTSDEADRRQRAYGHNEFDITEDEPLWKKYLAQVCISTSCHLTLSFKAILMCSLVLH